MSQLHTSGCYLATWLLPETLLALRGMKRYSIFTNMNKRHKSVTQTKCEAALDPARSTVERLSGFDHDNSLTVKSMEALVRVQLSRVNTFSANESSF